MSMEITPPEWPSRWAFGLAPLSQAVEFARAVRSLTEAVLSLDAPSARLGQLIEDVRATDEELRAYAGVTSAVRVGAGADDPALRPYLDHSIHIGGYNPAFPEYSFSTLDADRATGSVQFSIAYEGPPGLVHGGFLAVFFDAVIAHHCVELGVAGKTKTLGIRYVRPTPLGETLGFEIDRQVDGREILCEASLLGSAGLLCTAQARSVAGKREDLPRVGGRRTETMIGLSEVEPPPRRG